MNKLPDTTDILAAARAYAELKLPIIPLVGKVPAIRDWQKFVVNEVNLVFWFGPDRRANIGLRTGESGYLVIDTDSEEAEEWVRTHCDETRMQALTGSGSKHRYYANPPRKEIRNRQGLRRIHGLDVRGHGGFIVLPPSIHPETGEPYRWIGDFLQPDGLPRFSPNWVRERTRRKVHMVLHDDKLKNDDLMAYRALRWLECVEGAVSGQGGHNKTYRVACRLTHLPPHGFGLGFETAMRLMLTIFNPKCSPLWSEKEIAHKLEDALKERK